MAAARRPMISTMAITTEMTVFLVVASISRGAPPHTPAAPLLHQSARFVGVQLVIIAFTECDGRLKFRFRGGGLSRLQHDPSELQMRAAVHPLPPFERKRALQVRLRVRGAAHPRAGRAAFVRPQRVLAEHP